MRGGVLAEETRRFCSSGTATYIISTGDKNTVSYYCSKCELRHDLFYVDNTEQVRGVLLGHA